MSTCERRKTNGNHLVKKIQITRHEPGKHNFTMWRDGDGSVGVGAGAADQRSFSAAVYHDQYQRPQRPKSQLVYSSTSARAASTDNRARPHSGGRRQVRSQRYRSVWLSLATIRGGGGRVNTNGSEDDDNDDDDDDHFKDDSEEEHNEDRAVSCAGVPSTFAEPVCSRFSH